MSTLAEDIAKHLINCGAMALPAVNSSVVTRMIDEVIDKRMLIGGAIYTPRDLKECEAKAYERVAKHFSHAGFVPGRMEEWAKAVRSGLNMDVGNLRLGIKDETTSAAQPAQITTPGFVPLNIVDAISIYKSWESGTFPFSSLIERATRTIEMEGKLRGIDFDLMLKWQAQ